MARKKRNQNESGGKLRIGDNWNAITIIALSQNNPLKAIAEFVENSIDAKARNITIIRGKEKGDYYLKIIDDGNGIPCDDTGVPNFKYVATHICDSIKRKLKNEGAQGLQGEFGIGLLSFWTVGEKLFMTSAGDDGKTYCMLMEKNQPGYTIQKTKVLFADKGTELKIYPLLPGIRNINGSKIQNYLASELRDRIRKSEVNILIKDRVARKELKVEPRQFEGRLLHHLEMPKTEYGELYHELYLSEYSPENRVGLYRMGTRVLPSIGMLDEFNGEPWTSGMLQGIIDCPFLQLTPGTRDGIIRDAAFEAFIKSVECINEPLEHILEEQKKALEEKASKSILKSVQKALKEAFLALPREEYNWLEVYTGQRGKHESGGKQGDGLQGVEVRNNEQEILSETGATESGEEKVQKQFFDFPGPLYSVRISPSSAIVNTGKEKKLRALCRDRKRKVVDSDLEFYWEIKEGEGTIDNPRAEIITYSAPSEPGLCLISLIVRQKHIRCDTESVITVTEELLNKPENQGNSAGKGLPGYTYKRAPGELWRSYYDRSNNIIVINNGHGDFVYASKKNSRKIRYICRLFAKELVLENFPGIPANELLERMVELMLYTEENLK